MFEITLAQAVGEEPFREGITWTPDEIEEWFAGDVDAAREHFGLDYSDALERERAKNARLQARLLELEPGGYVDGWD